MRVLVLDCNNLVHRARYGFTKGDNSTVFGFFRSLRPIVEKHAPDRVYVALEGYPRDNKALLPEYKATRKVSPDDFRRQRDKIEHLLTTCFPFVVLRHPNFEADDTIYNAVIQEAKDPSADVTVVSTDTDFIQLYDTLENVTVWDPVNKKTQSAPDYKYSVWKALRGDPGDNIPGIPGVGDKRATEMALDATKLELFLADPRAKSLFERNVRLVGFQDFTSELSDLEVWAAEPDFEKIKREFTEMGFASIVGEDRTWSKFVGTFSSIRSGRPQWLKT